MKMLYELGRMASHQSLKDALPDPDGLRELMRRGLVQLGPQGHYELAPRGVKLAERVRATLQEET